MTDIKIKITVTCPVCGIVHEVEIKKEIEWDNKIGYYGDPAEIYVDYTCDCGHWVYKALDI